MKLILACDPDGGIGYKNRLPWDRLHGDLARFKELTINQVVVMGRVTWETLPIKPLPQRVNVVVTSKTLDRHDIITIPNLKAFNDFNNAWLIGGARLINSNWDFIDEVYLTRTHSKYACDTYVNLISLQNDFHVYSSTRYNTYDYEIWKRETY